MSDLISRKYAIYELRDLIIEPDISDDEIKIEGYNEGLETAISLLSVLSSALPEERTSEVIEHDASVTDTDGYKYHRSEYLCGACKKKVLGGDDYCSHCGSKLIWGEEE